MSVDLAQIFPFVVLLPWFGVAVVLLFRYRTKQREYLRHFASNGISLDVPPGSIASLQVHQAIHYVMRQRQTNPELEQLRRDTWRRYRLMAFWALGYPVFIFVTIVGLGVSGLVHYR